MSWLSDRTSDIGNSENEAKFNLYMCVLMTGFLIKTLRNEEFGFYLKAWCKFLKLDFTVLHLLCE